MYWKRNLSLEAFSIIALLTFNIGHVERKPVFRFQTKWISYQSPQLQSLAWKLKVSSIARLHIILSIKLITKTLIRQRGCAGWSAPVFFANPPRQVFWCYSPYHPRTWSDESSSLGHCKHWGLFQYRTLACFRRDVWTWRLSLIIKFPSKPLKADHHQPASSLADRWWPDNEFWLGTNPLYHSRTW